MLHYQLIVTKRSADLLPRPHLEEFGDITGIIGGMKGNIQYMILRLDGTYINAVAKLHKLEG
jgi:hypothetical protein